MKFSNNSVVKSNLLRNKIYLYYSVNVGLISSCPRVTTATWNLQIKDKDKKIKGKQWIYADKYASNKIPVQNNAVQRIKNLNIIQNLK